MTVYLNGEGHEVNRKWVLSYIFPLSYLSNAFAMTGLLIAFGLGGQVSMAADVGLVQGATLAFFYAFSANARNIILSRTPSISLRTVLTARLILLVPLGAASFGLSVYVVGIDWLFALLLILRRGVEWIGELHLCEMELRGDRNRAGQFIVLQILLFLMLLGWIFSGAAFPMLGVFLWCLLPVFMSLNFIRNLFTLGSRPKTEWFLMLPHLGSSAVIGITVYVFRLLILLIVGKAVAGAFYVAFAIGGVLSSMFTMGLGPSLVLHEQKTGREYMPVWLRTVFVNVALAGIILSAFVYFGLDQPSVLGKDKLFWQTLGLSLIGGVVMVFAQRQRLRSIQNGTEGDVFASDVLVNILIVAVIPFIYFIFGVFGLSGLYLFNALVALVFYWLADVKRGIVGTVTRVNEIRVKAVFAALLIIPVFVCLETGVFRSQDFLYNSGGILSKLPIPLSAFACYAGIALLGNYRKANLGLAVIFGSFVLMVLSTVIVTYSNPHAEKAKVLLLVQYLLPMFGLVLGMMFEDRTRNELVAEKTMLIVIAAIIPTQLLASLVQAQMFLTPYLYLFSIYQHLQYVPSIIVSCYLVALFSLWNDARWQRVIYLLAPLLGIYVVASGSMLTALFALAGCAAFTVHRTMHEKCLGSRVHQWAILSLVLGAGTLYNIWSMWIWKISGKFGMYTQKFRGGTILNVQQRVDYWLYYINGILSDPFTFLLGHHVPPDRKLWPSAHNYYLDFMYNFGFIAAVVLMGLVIFTGIQLYKNRKHIVTAPSLLGLTVVVLFLLGPDNLVKVGMRQLYPGIITFFLWGLLLARIKSLQQVEQEASV